MTENFEASCLRGGIRLRYSGKLGASNYCHCEDCRRANGSAFNIGLQVDRKDLEVKATTEMKSYRFKSGSGREIQRCFCGTCGSPIFTLHPARPEYAWVKAGIIHQPEIVKPAYENWVKDKVKWAVINVTESNDEGRPT
ncbi:MAG TPA: GFA family protein [Candidatus Angelobacter sp.]|nr:GFA family protein [Candidatus Angelobacter sp.]